MKTSWAALSARARGLSTHLLTEEATRVVERAATLTELSLALRDTPYSRFVPPGDATPAGLELAVTRSLARRMAILARWAGPGASALNAVFIDQDARNVREIVRGMLAGAGAEQRIGSLIPTPSLGRKELEVLEHAESVAAAVATLALWGHPLGSALLEEAQRAHPDPFRLEAALARRAAAETLRAARRADRRMLAFVREEIDAANAVTALLLHGARTESDAGDFFIDGGAGIGRDDFLHAASAHDRTEAAHVLARATAGTSLTAPLRGHPATPAALSGRILSSRIEDLARQMRLDPVSATPVLLFVLRIRREARIVRRALWAAALVGGYRA